MKNDALRWCKTHSQCVSLTLPRAPLKLSLLHSIVFHIILRRCETYSRCVFLAPSRAPLKLSLSYSIVFHMLLRVGSIPTLHLKTFEQVFWTTLDGKIQEKRSGKRNHGTFVTVFFFLFFLFFSFLVSFHYAGSETLDQTILVLSLHFFILWIKFIWNQQFI